MTKGGRQASRAGFTLVELMISMTIFGVLSVAILTSTLLFSKTFARLSSEADLSRRVRTFESAFIDDARAANSVAQLDYYTLRFTYADASTIDYVARASSDGSHSFVRVSAGAETTLLPDLEAWSYALPTATRPLIAEWSVHYNDPTVGSRTRKLALRVSPRAKVTL